MTYTGIASDQCCQQYKLVTKISFPGAPIYGNECNPSCKSWRKL